MTTKEEKMEILRLSDVPLQEVKWLWYPYIPFGKITIIQGDPGEGKTTLALRLAAACTTGQTLPGMEATKPFTGVHLLSVVCLSFCRIPRLDQGVNKTVTPTKERSFCRE